MTNSWRLERGLQLLARARLQHADAKALAEHESDAGDVALRESLAAYWSAMNWLDKGTDFDAAHEELHLVGRVARSRFASSCQIDFSNGGYGHACPVVLAHNRFGMSPGFTGNAVCSICGGDASECEHFPGRSYIVRASVVRGRCNVCAAESCGSHHPGEPYEVQAIVVVTEASLDEVSIVSDPAQPDARLTRVSISTAEIERVVGLGFEVGDEVRCDYCLHPCGGMVRID